MIKANLPLLPQSASMQDVLVTLTHSNLGCVGLTAPDGTLAGIFTDGDLKRRFAPDLLSKTAADVMTPNPKTIAADALATRAVAQMEQQNVTNLWVTQEGKPQGLVRLHECLHAGVC